MKTQKITIGTSFLSQGPNPKEQREAMEKRLAQTEQRDTARRGVLTHDGKRDAMSPLYEELNRYYTRNYTDAQFEAILAHAERLAEALRDCVTTPGALAERSHEYALRRLATITATATEALAAWENQ